MAAIKLTKEWLTQRVENAPIAYHRNLPEMVAFQNPSNTWKRVGTQTGYALLRDGKIVDSVVVLTE